jgi:arginase
MLHNATARHPAASNRLSLIGVPTDAGASRRGAVMGPAALRVADLAARLIDLGFIVEDRGDVAPVTGARSEKTAAEEIMSLARLASAAGQESLRQGARPVFLGGDHSISMGSVAGVAKHCRDQGRELFVLWIDAHGDFNTPRTSETGNIHGMSLALLCGEPDFAAVRDDSWYAPVDPRNVTIFGARSLDRAERELMQSRGVDIVDMRRIDEHGVAPLLRQLIERVEAVNGHLHISLDVDAMDPAIAPGVGTTVPGGLTFREAHLIMEMLHDSGTVGSLDIVELNPFLDHAGKSAELLVDLTASLFGRRIVERTLSPDRHEFTTLASELEAIH